MKVMIDCNFVYTQLHKEFMRCCTTAKDFLVQWEDMAPVVVDWASSKSNQMASLLVDELRADGKPSLGMTSANCFVYHFCTGTAGTLHACVACPCIFRLIYSHKLQPAKHLLMLLKICSLTTILWFCLDASKPNTL